jgi:D-glycero-D-manno-heptose 1,7-bisphosphate phosphatase
MTSIDPATSKGRVHEDIGMWVRVRGGPSAIPRPALFLDRDGVILEDTGYLCRAADMILIPGVAEVIGLANRREIPVIEVTNQAGIGRGYYGWEQFVEVEEALAVELARGGAFIDAVFARTTAMASARGPIPPTRHGSLARECCWLPTGF